jgi:cytochrome c-type biogenesis protein CcmH
MIWVVFAALTGFAVLSVLLPLARARGRAAAVPAVDRALYDATIAGIDRDLERGLTTVEDASAARTEAARRLLAAAPSGEGVAHSRWARRAAAVIALVFIPGLTLGLYAYTGASDYPDQPLEARLKSPVTGNDINVALARIEQHLADEPGDARGWEIVAPVYLRLGRPRDAARAWQQVIKLNGVTADRASSFGEALVYAEDGKVTPLARAAFESALKADEKEPRARFFLGVAAEQDGDVARAVEIWTRLLNDSPADAPFAPAVRERIQSLGSAPPAASGPNSPAGAAIAALPPEDQQKFIRGMVAQLAERLAHDGGDSEGWLRLVRAYSVLGDADKARAAMADARKALDGNTAALGQLDTLARELGLGG